MPTDSVYIFAPGFDTLCTVALANRFNIYQLSVSILGLTSARNKIISFSKDSLEHQQIKIYHGAESYTSIVENEFLSVSSYPKSGFAMHIDRASYSNIRRFINNEMTVPPDAVRIEEMLNYFNLGFQKDSSAANQFQCHTQITRTPWKQGNRLFFVNIQSPTLLLESLPPANLIFLVDISGSMDQPNRLPLLQQGLKLLVSNLREKDTVALVVYGGTTAIVLHPTAGNKKAEINEAIDQLTAAGNTPGESALRMAYSLARRMFNAAAQNRIILATDGDFNVGMANDSDLEELVDQFSSKGIFLSCLGFGMGNYKNSKLEALARRGNGNFAYIDVLQEAEKVMMSEYTKSVFVVATDAFVTVDFNPNMVSRYRLIGFDNRASELETNQTALEGGELGPGHSLTAVFEIEPSDTTLKNDVFANLEMHYKTEKSSDTVINWQSMAGYTPFNKAHSNIKLATAIIMFGELLKKSDLVTGYTWDHLIEFTRLQINPEKYLERELLQLIEKAKKIYNPPIKSGKKSKQEAKD